MHNGQRLGKELLRHGFMESEINLTEVFLMVLNNIARNIAIATKLPKETIE